MPVATLGAASVLAVIDIGVVTDNSWGGMEATLVICNHIKVGEKKNDSVRKFGNRECCSENNGKFRNQNVC